MRWSAKPEPCTRYVNIFTRLLTSWRYSFVLCSTKYPNLPPSNCTWFILRKQLRLSTIQFLCSRHGRCYQITRPTHVETIFNFADFEYRPNVIVVTSKTFTAPHNLICSSCNYSGKSFHLAGYLFVDIGMSLLANESGKLPLSVSKFYYLKR